MSAECRVLSAARVVIDSAVSDLLALAQTLAVLCFVLCALCSGWL